jgi:hypothetical protein
MHCKLAWRWPVPVSCFLSASHPLPLPPPPPILTRGQRGFPVRCEHRDVCTWYSPKRREDGESIDTELSSLCRFSRDSFSKNIDRSSMKVFVITRIEPKVFFFQYSYKFERKIKLAYVVFLSGFYKKGENFHEHVKQMGLLKWNISRKRNFRDFY